ncbi:putative bacteriocin [Streptococcus pneumoniae]|nr:putative bacteriocin [Streptococcus pneumoniae]
MRVDKVLNLFGAERSILILCVVFILTVVLLQRACREELAHKGD